VKLSRFAGLGFIAALVACNPTLPPPPPGWNLELRAGTTNIDSSFFQSTKPDTTRSSVDATRFAQLREAIIKKVPSLNLGSALASGFVTNPKATKTSTRETYALALSLFMAVTKDGAAPTSDLSFIYSGPEGTYDKPITYPAGYAWLASPLVIPKGNGSYTFSSTLQDGTLAGSVSVNFEDQTQWLPLPMAVNNPNGSASMNQYANVLLANWQAVSEAQSYIGLVFDRTDKKYVASFLTTGTRVESQEFNGLPNHDYTLDLIATTIDLSKDATKPYGTIPATMKSSISSFEFKHETPNLSIPQTRVDLLVKPNQSNEALLKISNVGLGALSYTASVSGAGLEIIAEGKGLLANTDSRDIRIKGTCTNADVVGSIAITSNDPTNKVKTVPILLECDTPFTTTLELQKLTHTYDIQAMQYSPDGKKIATTDSSEVIIWDALTGAVIRRFGVSGNDVLKGNVYSLAWNPDNNLLLVGMTNNVMILDTKTGLSTITVNPAGVVLSVDWNSDGSQFVIGVPYTALIYSSANGNLVRQIDMPGKSDFIIIPLFVSWSKSSNKLATSFDKNVYVWDTNTGLMINHYAAGSKFDTYSSNALVSVSWNPTGDKLAIYDTYNSSQILIWSVNSSILERSIRIDPNNFPDPKNGLFDVKWNPHNSEIAVILRKYIDGTNWDFSAQIWDSSNGLLKTQFPIKTIQYQQVSALEWNPDGSNILTRATRFAFGQRIVNGEQSLQLGFAPGKIASMKMNQNATKLVISSSLDYGIADLSLMNIPSGLTLPSIKTFQAVTAIDWRKDTEEILGVLGNVSGAQTVSSFNIMSASFLGNFEGDKSSTFSPDGQRIATIINKVHVHILDASTKMLLKIIELPPCNCNFSEQAIIWNSSGTRIAIRDSDGYNLRIFDVLTGALIWEKSINSSIFLGSALLWSPNDKIINSGASFFDALTGESLEIINRNFSFDSPPSSGAVFPNPSTPLAWSPDNRYILSQKSTVIELRNATSGRKVASIQYIPPVNVTTVKAAWNTQANRFAFTDGQSSVYIYKFSQP
jgi:WD40 repeat protein